MPVGSIETVRLLGRNTGVLTCPADTNENTAMTKTLPGRTLGNNGKIRIEAMIEYTPNANNKTTRFKLGATTIFTIVRAGVGAEHIICIISNLNSESLQDCLQFNGTGTTSNTFTTATEDTTTDKTITVTMQKADSADTYKIHSLTIEILADGT